jgi:hypothetical protein
MKVWRNDYFWPVVLVALGLYFLLRNLGLLDWLSSDIVWPVLIIILGVWLIVRRTRRDTGDGGG